MKADTSLETWRHLVAEYALACELYSLRPNDDHWLVVQRLKQRMLAAERRVEGARQRQPLLGLPLH